MRKKVHDYYVSIICLSITFSLSYLKNGTTQCLVPFNAIIGCGIGDKREHMGLRAEDNILATEFCTQFRVNSTLRAYRVADHKIL
jgi:hypothetical protein